MSQKNKKVNLLIYIAGLHHGGAERVVASLCNNLDPDRYTITVCWRTGLGMIGKEIQSHGHKVIGLPEIDPNITPYRRFLVLKKLIKKRNIDVVHTHDTGSLADAAQCRILGSRIRLVHTFHFGNYPHLKKSYLYMEMLFGRLASALIAVGYEQEKRIRKALHLPQNKIRTIYNGVEIPKPVTDEDLTAPFRNKPGNPVIIGSISTLIEQKGLTYLLDAAAVLKRRNTNCVFLIAGDGALREELEQKRDQLQLKEMVHFLGWVPNAANNILHHLDIFCQSSLWEGNSIVLLEAMACGLPIVTTEVGESKHVIDEGKIGHVIIPRDPQELADALSGLIENPQLRQQMSEAAKKKFAGKYTINSMIESYDRVYSNFS